MKKKEFQGIAYTLSRREELLGLILVAIILSIGTNLIAAWLISAVPNVENYIFWIGLALIVAPLIYLGVRFLAARHGNYITEAAFIFDPEKNRIVDLPEYEFSEKLCRTLDAVFLENEAIKAAWESEPIVESEETETPLSNDKKEDQSFDDEQEVSYFAVVKVENKDGESEAYTKSEMLLCEAIEFAVLDELSTHLSGYFQDFPDNDNLITEYIRQDVPSLLLENRVLSLLTTPLEDRAIFFKSKIAQKPPEGEVESIYGSDGSYYSRFNLILPKSTKVSRPLPGVLKLENNRISLELFIDYDGFATNIPVGLTESLIGKKTFGLRPMQVDIHLNTEIKVLALLSGGGWKYHEWIDSFVERLQEFSSFDDYLERIGWRIVSTNLQATRRLFSGRQRGAVKESKKLIKQKNQ